MKLIKTIGVVGAGAMGRGIAQLFAQSGFTVFCYDMSKDATNDAIEYIKKMIRKSVDKGRLEVSVLEALNNNLLAASSLQDLSECDMVIEAIVENVSVKQGLFEELESIISEDAILASNTSSLVIAEIASQCQHPERVAGLHFFNPVPLMKVAEIIAAVRTHSSVIHSLKNLVEATGHRAVIAEDQPGFLVNHAGRGLYTEGLRIVEEQVAPPKVVDTILREAANFRMGPFELMDLTGLDVSGKVMESIYQQFLHEPRFRPSSLVPPRISAGLFGRKTSQGWYSYQDGKRIDSQDATIDYPSASGAVWIDHKATDAEALKQFVIEQSWSLAQQPEDADLILIQPWGQDASGYCAENHLAAHKVVAIDPLPGLDKHRTLMLTCVTTESARNMACTLFSADGVPFSVINDSPGFICQRVIATIVNIAANIAQRGIASVDDLEDAVKIGLGYPSGPLHLGDSVGAANIFEILTQQQKITGDDRYRPSLWLRRRAQLGLALTSEEARRS